MADDLKKIEGRAYAKGYAAGRRRLETDIDRAIEAEARQKRFDCYYAAAMTGLLAGNAPWRNGGKPDSCPGDYADTAREIARAMMKRGP